MGKPDQGKGAWTPEASALQAEKPKLERARSSVRPSTASSEEGLGSHSSVSTASLAD